MDRIRSDRPAAAIVVIGRNEGDRLIRCLGSIGDAAALYVDSGSDDGSPERAEALGVAVERLDPGTGFTAARARNAGLARLGDDPPAFVQMLDGDCELDPGWLATATAAMEADPGLAAVFGRLRERCPEASVYNWLCDIEWAVPPGPVAATGGVALFRSAALLAAQGYRSDMIAGEEPELAIRLRRAGWRLRCLDAEMALHDAAITRFGQWWRRTARGGHAFAELAALHPGGRDHGYRTNCRRAALWGGLLPILLLVGLLLGGLGWAPGFLLAAAAVLLTLAQLARLTLREARHRSLAQAFTLAAFLVLGKYAEAIGMLRFHANRLGGRRSRLVDYKRAGAA